MSEQVEVTFFVPCYNEAPHIAGTLTTLRDLMNEKKISYEILVVDDASTDNSAEIIQDFSRKNPQVPLQLCRNTENKGLGFNYLHSTNLAHGKYYMLVNGDNDLPPECISDVLQNREKAQMVIPYVENQEDRPWIRAKLSHAFTFLVNLLGGHKLKYYNGPVIHLRENVERYKPDTHGFGYQAELLCRALNHGTTYYEIPFRCIVRQKTHLAAFRPRNIAAVLASLRRIFLYRLTDQNGRPNGKHG